MANFPIEIMVKLTYNIYEVITMADFCLDCWNEINETSDPPNKYRFSKSKNLCEGCGEFKNTIECERKISNIALIAILLFPFKWAYYKILFW